MLRIFFTWKLWAKTKTTTIQQLVGCLHKNTSFFARSCRCLQSIISYRAWWWWWWTIFPCGVARMVGGRVVGWVPKHPPLSITNIGEIQRQLCWRHNRTKITKKSNSILKRARRVSPRFLVGSIHLQVGASSFVLSRLQNHTQKTKSLQKNDDQAAAAQTNLPVTCRKKKSCQKSDKQKNCVRYTDCELSRCG